MSADHPNTLEAFTKNNNIKHLLLSDFRRQMLPTYGAMVTDEKSPIYRYAKRAYFILDRQGTVRWMKIQANALDLLKPEEVLKALKEVGSLSDASSSRASSRRCSRHRLWRRGRTSRRCGSSPMSLRSRRRLFPFRISRGKPSTWRTSGAKWSSSSSGRPGDWIAGRSYLPSTSSTPN